MKSYFSVRPVLSCALVLSLVSLNGCIAGLTYNVPGTSAAATSIYAIDENNNKIDKYSLSTSGSVTASVVLSPPSGSSSYSVSAVATDSTGQVYMGYAATGSHESIAVFAAGATSSSTPARTFTTGYTYSQGPNSIFVDAQGLVYATVTGSTIAVYAANATGAATPLRTITGLTNVEDIAADSSGNVYAVSFTNPGSILVFSSTATGSVAPTRTITAATGYEFFGVAVDASGDVFASENLRSGTGAGYIAEFAPSTTTPAKTITPPQSSYIAAVRLDAAGNVYAEVQMNASPQTTSLAGFASTATGVSTPFIAVTSSTIYTSDYDEIAVF